MNNLLALRRAPKNQENGPNSPDPFPPFGGGVWGRDYWHTFSTLLPVIYLHSSVSQISFLIARSIQERNNGFSLDVLRMDKYSSKQRT